MGEKTLLRNAQHAALYIVAVHAYHIGDATFEKSACPCANATSYVDYAFEGE